MTRRAGGRARGVVVPGLSAALAADARRFDRAFPGGAFADWAAAYEAGEPVVTQGSIVRGALGRSWCPAFVVDDGRYVVAGDRIEPA